MLTPVTNQNWDRARDCRCQQTKCGYVDPSILWLVCTVIVSAEITDGERNELRSLFGRNVDTGALHSLYTNYTCQETTYFNCLFALWALSAVAHRAVCTHGESREYFRTYPSLKEAWHDSRLFNGLDVDSATAIIRDCWNKTGNQSICPRVF